MMKMKSLRMTDKRPREQPFHIGARRQNIRRAVFKWRNKNKNKLELIELSTVFVHTERSFAVLLKIQITIMAGTLKTKQIMKGGNYQLQ